MSDKNSQDRGWSGSSAILPLLCAVCFISEALFVRYSLATAFDVLILFALLLLPGALIFRSINYRFDLRFSSHETISIGACLGFGLNVLAIYTLHALGIREVLLPLACTLAIVTSIVTLSDRNAAPSSTKTAETFDHFALSALFVILFLAAYNLRQFHFLADGSIVTKGLFGVDLPFLAGEIHGIRDFGALRDLHQNAQPWHYHEAIYQLLSILPRGRTLEDLSLVAPLVGYTLLAFTTFTLLYRATGSQVIACASIAALFLIGGFTGTDQGSYALSPSFVFGTILFFSFLIIIDRRSQSVNRAKRARWFLIELALLILLSQTKLTTYLVLIASIFLVAAIRLLARRKTDWEMPGVAVLSFIVVLVQSITPNPFMPGSDFLIGAPLLGYANHLSTALHIPLSYLNPVSHGLSLRWQSLFVFPYFIFHFARFVLLDPRLLVVLVLLLFFRKQLRKSDRISLSTDTIDLLLVIIAVGFFLPVLYSPAWYPLALSFYAPLVSIQSALIVSIIGITWLLSQPRERKRTIILSLIAIIGFVGLIQNTRYLAAETSAAADTTSIHLVHAGEYLQTHTPDQGVILTHRFDFNLHDTLDDESYYWYAALSGRAVASEGAKYGSLLAATADFDSAKGLHPERVALSRLRGVRTALDTLFQSSDVDQADNAARSLHGTWILEDTLDHATADISHFGSEVWREGDIRLWKLQ